MSRHGLDRFVAGDATTLYHGTTASFREFDLSKSRDELVDLYYGRGIFLTPSWRVAERYAEANRNAGLPSSIIDDMGRRNEAAAEMLRALHELGAADAWEHYARRAGFWRDRPGPGEGMLDYDGLERHIGVDPNDLADVSRHIVGTKTPHERDLEPLELFGGSTGAPHWLYDKIDQLGLDSRIYRPKVYTVTATTKRPLVTANKRRASEARSRGFDAVVYCGDRVVDGVPEVAVFDGQNARITRVEILE